MLMTEIETISVNDAVKRASESKVTFIDVRSPKEYKEAHVKNAISLPILDDLERHEVGITYKHISREKAIEKGTEFFLPKVEDFIRTVKEKAEGSEIILYCWRGGYRSKAVTELLTQQGISVRQMTGGFKSYIKWIQEEIKYLSEELRKKKCYVLAGKTGTNKTALLRLLSEDYPVLDLEYLAQHRSSVFGAINLMPRSQKQFLIDLYYELNNLKDKPFFIIENESSRIGNVCVPKNIMHCIHNASVILLKRSINARVKSIIEEYLENKSEIKRIYQIVEKIQKYIGKKNVIMLRKLLDDEEYEEFTKFLLERYYDLTYALPKREPFLVVEEDDIEEVREQIERSICSFQLVKNQVMLT